MIRIIGVAIIIAWTSILAVALGAGAFVLVEFLFMGGQPS